MHRPGAGVVAIVSAVAIVAGSAAASAGGGVGASGREVFDAWSASSVHRTVMQMASGSKAGTAVSTSYDGRRWVALDVCG